LLTRAGASTLPGVRPRPTVYTEIPFTPALEWTIDGLAPSGKLIVFGAPEDGPVVVNPFPLLLGRRTVTGWPAGTGMDSEDTFDFSVLARVKPKKPTTG